MVLMENLINKAKKIFGTTDSCKYSTFILPEGKALNIIKQTSTVIDYHPHDGAAKKVLENEVENISGWNATEKFIDLTGSIRYVPMRSHINVQIGLKNLLTKEQVEFIERCSCFVKPKKEVVYDFVIDDEVVRASGTYDEVDCFKGIDKLKKDFKKYHNKQSVIEDLEKKLKKHWEDTVEERKRTHTGKIYEKYMKEKGYGKTE
jgi:hypothetical protein